MQSPSVTVGRVSRRQQVPQDTAGLDAAAGSSLQTTHTDGRQTPQKSPGPGSSGHPKNSWKFHDVRNQEDSGPPEPAEAARAAQGSGGASTAGPAGAEGAGRTTK